MHIEEMDDSESQSQMVVKKDESGSESGSGSAKKAFVGAGGRILFYPTLFYNVVRNKLESEFRWWDEVDQFVLLGAVPFPKHVPLLKDLGVRGVVTLNEAYETLVPASLYQDHGIKHLVIPTRDYLFAPSFDDIWKAVNFIHENAVSGNTTYVHCKAGRGRSTTIVLCYLVEFRHMTPTRAYEYVRSKRPRVLLAASQWQAVQDYERRRKTKQLNCNDLSKHSLQCSVMPVSFPLQLNAADIRVPEKDTAVCEDIVIVTAADLDGYRSIEDAGLIGNEFWKELGVTYRVRIIAARGVMGMMRASAALAKLSYLVSTHRTSIHPTSMKTLESCSMSEHLQIKHVEFSVCAQGVVNC